MGEENMKKINQECRIHVDICGMWHQNTEYGQTS